jgi:hypothetical protein
MPDTSYEAFTTPSAPDIFELRSHFKFYLPLPLNANYQVVTLLAFIICSRFPVWSLPQILAA